MLDKIEIRNFRNHKKIDIEFDPYVTTIVGSSFKGKSTIIRALRWIVRNKPAGLNFISWGKKQSRTRVTIDRKQVVRVRSKTENLYKKGKQEYRAFGNEVPASIQKLFNMSDINFQGQHDPPFWFCETAGEVSRQLNAIVNLAVIDKTFADLTSKHRTITTTIDIATSKLKTAKQQLVDLQYITDVDEDLCEIELLEKRKTQNASDRLRIDELVSLATNHRKNRNNAGELKQCGGITLEMGAEWVNITKNIKTLRILTKSADAHNQTISKRIPKINDVQSTYDTIIDIEDRIESLEDVIDTIEVKEKQICQTKGELKKCERELVVIEDGKCPLCGSMKKQK